MNKAAFYFGKVRIYAFFRNFPDQFWHNLRASKTEQPPAAPFGISLSRGLIALAQNLRLHLNEVGDGDVAVSVGIRPL